MLILAEISCISPSQYNESYIEMYFTDTEYLLNMGKPLVRCGKRDVKQPYLFMRPNTCILTVKHCYYDVGKVK